MKLFGHPAGRPAGRGGARGGAAALALARESGGIALDVLGFTISDADDLLPRPR